MTRLFLLILLLSLWFYSCSHQNLRNENKINKDSLLQKISEYTVSLSNDSNNYDFLSKRARAYRKIEEFEAALIDIQKVINLYPDSTKPFYERGYTYYSSKNYSKTIEEFIPLLKLDTNNVDVLSYLGTSYAELNKNKEAKPFFDKILKSDSLNVLAYCNRAVVYYSLFNLPNHDELALEDINKAIEIESDCGMYYYNRGGITWVLGNLQEAYDDFMMAKKLGYRSNEIDRDLKQLKEELNRITTATKKIKKYSKKIMSNPDNAEAYYFRGLNYLKTISVSFVKPEIENNVMSEAYNDFTKYLELEPQGKFSEQAEKYLYRFKEELGKKKKINSNSNNIQEFLNENFNNFLIFLTFNQC